MTGSPTRIEAVHNEPSPTVDKAVRTWRMPTVLAYGFVAVVFNTYFVAAGAPTPLMAVYQAQWHFPAWLVTMAFGAYALGLLAALLTLGKLSDFIGRRPVLISALALEAIAMIIFLVSSDIGWLVSARLVQGVATGLATGAFSASIIELAPRHRRAQAATINSAAPTGGLALGAVLAGAVADIKPAAAVTVWWVLTVVMAAGVVAAMFVPETISSRPGAVASLRPRVAVPTAVGAQFRVAAVTLTGAWMFAAFFIGLSPVVLPSLFDLHSPFGAGVVAALEPACAAFVTPFATKLTEHRRALLGGAAVATGAVLVLLALAMSALWLLCLGGIVGGVGFGLTFSGILGLLIPRAQQHERAGLFAAVYLAGYTAFGVPAIGAGILIGPLGVSAIAIAFGSAIVVSAVWGVIGQSRISMQSIARGL